MERLTFEGDFCVIAMCTSESETCDCVQRKVWERLKSYEDTGKTPEELQALVTAEQEGRLVVLPQEAKNAVVTFDLVSKTIDGVQTVVKAQVAIDSQK